VTDPTNAWRILFAGDHLDLVFLAVGLVGGAAFWGVLIHGAIVRRSAARIVAAVLVPPAALAIMGTSVPGAAVGMAAALVLAIFGRRKAGGPAVAGGAAEPILPLWQMGAGLALAGLLIRAALGERWGPGRGPIPGLALFIVATVAVVAWVVLFYLRVYRYLRRAALAGLLAARVLAVVLLVLLLFRPTVSCEEPLGRRTNLYVLVDSSRSMSVRDWPDSPHRLALAASQVEKYLPRLRTAFDVHVATFDTRARPLEDSKWPEPTGDATNVTRAFKDALATARRADATAVLLLSDGLHNAGGSVVEDVTALGPPPIYPVGIGTDLTAQSGYQDIAIQDVRAPEESVVNNIARLTVDVEAVGLADRSVEVQLREGETLLAAEPLRLDAAPGSQSIALTVTPTTVGRHTYQVTIPPDPAERRSENNSRQVHLLVTDPKIRVLYVEGVVRPEYKPLKSVLETDPNVELAALVQVRRGEFLQSGSLQGLTLSAFPQTIEDMRKFDVFILGDLDRSYFQAQQMENLKKAVSEGRGLLMTGGYNSFGPGGYEGTPVEAVLPVLVGPRDAGQETTPFVLKLTPEGADHPIFYGTTDFFQVQSARPREQLPELKGCTILGRARPGASVLAVHPARTGPSGPLIVLAVQPYGQGRTAAFAADTTYQWYLPFKALGRESPYVKFWGQMVRWLANKDIKEASDRPGVTLLVRKPYYNPGERVTVRAKVRAEEGRATNFAEVRAALLGPGPTDRKNFSLPLAPGGVGVYETELEPLDPGPYKVAVEARKDNQRLGDVEEVEFAVGRPNQEFERLNIDRALLKHLAQASGGQYYEPAAFADLVEALRGRTRKEDVHREVGLQTVPYFFAVLFGAFLLLVTGEWLVRKYYQLN
jgi:uncharacterized membrane protein